MKKTISFILLAFLLSGCGFKNWSTYDKAIYVASWGLTVADIGQTRYAYDHPDEFNESLIRWFNDKDSATLYLIGINAGVGVAADMVGRVNPTWRSTILTGWTIGKGILVVKNDSVGVEIEF
jgi:hypothetical protein